jgi:hypothetical protein
LTKQGYTALVFVVDASGSMFPIAHDMEGAIEALLAKQKNLPGTLTVDMVYFDAPSFRATPTQPYYTITSAANVVPSIIHRPVKDWYHEAHTLADPSAVRVHIEPGGGTALLDALGRKIVSFGQTLSALPEDERPENVIFAIVTDGEENSSQEYTWKTIQHMIEHQTDTYGWNFTYLGANQDAISVGASLGIGAGSTLTWNVNNVAAAAQTMDSYIATSRALGAAAASYTQADREANA